MLHFLFFLQCSMFSKYMFPRKVKYSADKDSYIYFLYNRFSVHYIQTLYGLYHHKCHSGLVFMKPFRIRIKIRLKLKILLIWTFLKPTVNSILLTDGFVKICTPNKTSRNYKFFCEIWDMKM